MSKRILSLGFFAALAVCTTAWFAGAAQAGPASVCGDGTIEGAEECDDTNTVTGDGCSFPSCLPEVCGDGTINPDDPGNEECDDSNTVDDDGCTAPACQNDCGDSETDAGLGETCDEGNDTNGDGCDDDVANGGNCTDTGCPNGVVTGTEECDDGNTNDTDSCRNDCTVPSAPQDKKQQGCINAINKNLAGVIKAQNADNSACIKDVAAAKQPNTAACLGTDLKGKVAKAQTKTTTTEGKKCNDAEEVPTFAHTTPTTVNAAGEDEVLGAATEVLGAAPSIALKSADKDGAKCQAEAMKHLGAVGNKWAAEANKAKKKALKGSGAVPGSANGTDLAAAIDTAIAASASLTKAGTKATTGLGNKCTDAQVDGFFDCGGATTVAALATCVIDSAERAACEALEAADGLALTCP